MRTLLLIALASVAYAQGPAGSVAGTVSLPAPDGQLTGIPGATLTLTCANVEPRVDVSDAQGAFHFPQAASGDCIVTADLDGFTPVTKKIVVTAGDTTTVALTFDLEALHEHIDVVASARASDSNPIDSHVATLDAAAMQLAPVATDRFQNALPLIPGVVRGPDGLLNVSGGRSNQAAMMFTSADGTDPVTGDDAIELPIDAISSVDVRGAAFAPEYGLSTGAVTSVDTQRGGDAWHVTLNDLEPRLRFRANALHGIESWTPRFTTGGPLVAGKVALLESLQYEYSQTRVYDLPALASDTELQAFESYTRLDWTLSPTDHVTASALASPRKTTYAGLNPFNPQPVTPDINNHNVLVTASAQTVLGASGLLENRASVKQFDTTIYPSQGTAPMALSPDVNSGSYFNSQNRTSRRIEGLTTYTFAPLGAAHVLKVGAGAAYETFEGTSVNRPVEILREDGALSSVTSFSGSGLLDRDRTALRGFAQDTWTVAPRLTMVYGARDDYDSFTGDVNVAPRVSLTAVVSEDGRTVVRAGSGLFYDLLPLNVAAFGQQQTRTVIRFMPDGETAIGLPATLTNTIGSAPHTPRSVNTSIEIDREWLANLFVRIGYQQRDTRFEPIVTVAPSALTLETTGRSRYHAGEATARYQFHGTDQIVASYTRSSAVGDLNDYNGYFGNLQNPVVQPNARGPLPWDAPNRWLFWSSLSLPKGFSVFPVLDLRTGFPYSIVDEDRSFVGARNEAGRYPTFVSLDAQVAKRFRMLGHKATIGLKVFNITDHENPRDFQGNLASAHFGDFYNSVGRTFRGKWIFEF